MVYNVKNNSKTLKLLTIPILVLFILGLIFKLNLKVTADNNLDKNFVEIHFIDVGKEIVL